MIDSANVVDIFQLVDTGLFRAVTTNPSVLAKENMGFRDIPQLHQDIDELELDFEFYQTVGDSFDSMLESGLKIHAMNSGRHQNQPRHTQVIVKVPANRAGYRAAGKLQESGAQVLLTAVYHSTQALAAKELGCWGIAPYAGRIEDLGWDPIKEIGNMKRILAASPVRVLAASLRTPEIIGELAASGVDDFTAAPKVWDAVVDNPQTADALGKFLEDEL